MKSPLKGALIAAAVAGLFVANAARAADEGKSEAKEVKCAGVNACKGHGACAGAGHGCAGKNACKGQGGCKASDNGCKGKNSCKGKGGCKTNDTQKKEEQNQRDRSFTWLQVRRLG